MKRFIATLNGESYINIPADRMVFNQDSNMVMVYNGIRPRRVAGVLLILALAWPVTYLAMLLYKFFNFLSEEDINAHDD